MRAFLLSVTLLVASCGVIDSRTCGERIEGMRSGQHLEVNELRVTRENDIAKVSSKESLHLINEALKKSEVSNYFKTQHLHRCNIVWNDGRTDSIEVQLLENKRGLLFRATYGLAGDQIQYFTVLLQEPLTPEIASAMKLIEPSPTSSSLER